MKRNLFWLATGALFFLCSCATIQQPEVRTTGAGPSVSPTVAREAASARGLKRKVAIARFSNESKYGQSFFIDQNDDKIGKQALDILSNRLIQTDKFILLERADLEKIDRELGIGDAGKLRNMADYLILGSVTEFGRKETGEVGVFSRTKKQEAYAKVHIRMIDVYTSQVIYSEEGEGTAFAEQGTVFGVGGKAGYDSTLNDKALEAAINNLSSNIVENLMDKPWRGYILGQDAGRIIMSGGKSQNVHVGNVFEVVKEGKKVRNPQTNMDICLPGSILGRIEVVQSLGDSPAQEVSLCRSLDSGLKDYMEQNDFSTLYVSEPSSESGK